MPWTVILRATEFWWTLRVRCHYVHIYKYIHTYMQTLIWICMLIPRLSFLNNSIFNFLHILFEKACQWNFEGQLRLLCARAQVYMLFWKCKSFIGFTKVSSLFRFRNAFSNFTSVLDNFQFAQAQAQAAATEHMHIHIQMYSRSLWAVGDSKWHVLRAQISVCILTCFSMACLRFST